MGEPGSLPHTKLEMALISENSYHVDESTAETSNSPELEKWSRRAEEEYQRFLTTHHPTHLDATINAWRGALEFCLAGDQIRVHYLNKLAVTLGVRFRKTSKLDDLTEAIKLGQEALRVHLRGHPLRNSSLSALTITLSRRLGRRNRHVGPIEPGTTGSPETRCPTSSSPSDPAVILNRIIEIQPETLLPSRSPTRDHLHVAQTLENVPRRSGHGGELEAMTEILDLLEGSLANARSLNNAYQHVSEGHLVREFQTVASDAAALAFSLGDVRHGVALLERGRATIFAQLGRLRRTLDDVYESAPELARRFTDLSDTLSSLIVEEIQAEGKGETGVRTAEGHEASYQRARAEWAATVDEIRHLGGFESFLHHPPFEELQRAAACGPIVLLNINKTRSDAVILIASGDPILVPLPEATPEMVTALAARLGPNPAECHKRIVISTLQELWEILVSPIATQLRSERINLSQGSRVWWYPNGPASQLPLHAAGPYKRGEFNFSHLFISSYTPSLDALLRARNPRAEGPEPKTLSPQKRILVVGQPETPQERPLPNVVEEVTTIQKYAPHATILMSTEGLRESVLAGLQKHEWLHLACHGHHITTQPFLSHFSMHDGPISILDLIEKDLPHAEFAFLSACHSARVSEVLPDEVLHPAASLLFAGYKSVIGTMWAFDDALGSALAERFYKLMLDGEGGPKDHSDAAEMLTKAFEALDKDMVPIPFAQRINVVHYGA